MRTFYLRLSLFYAFDTVVWFKISTLIFVTDHVFNSYALSAEVFCSGCHGIFEPAQKKLISRIFKVQEYAPVSILI